MERGESRTGIGFGLTTNNGQIVRNDGLKKGRRRLFGEEGQRKDLLSREDAKRDLSLRRERGGVHFGPDPEEKGSVTTRRRKCHGQPDGGKGRNWQQNELIPQEARVLNFPRRGGDC